MKEPGTFWVGWLFTIRAGVKQEGSMTDLHVGLASDVCRLWRCLHLVLLLAKMKWLRKGKNPKKKSQGLNVGKREYGGNRHSSSARRRTFSLTSRGTVWRRKGRSVGARGWRVFREDMREEEVLPVIRQSLLLQPTSKKAKSQCNNTRFPFLVSRSHTPQLIILPSSDVS